MLLLVHLLLPSLSLSTLLRQGVTSGHPHHTHTTTPTPASPTSSVADPNKCIDIPCYKPIVWSDNEELVCRFRKEKKRMPKSKEKCVMVPETTCELVEYTKCDWNENPVPARDDKVVGEGFTGKECLTVSIPIIEIKMESVCINVTKQSCEEKWLPDPPRWEVDPDTCVPLNWTKCHDEERRHPVPIDICKCTSKDIWYNKLERKDVVCVEETTTCEPKLVPVCKTEQVRKCKTVSWIDFEETCEDDCYPMHFRTPSQEPDHRRWCSHVEIIVPSGVNVPSKADRELTDKQSTSKQSTDKQLNSKVTNSHIVSNQRSKNGNNFSNSKVETTHSSQRGNFQRTPNPDSLSNPRVYSRSGPSTNRRSSVSQGTQTIRQGQQIRG